MIDKNTNAAKCLCLYVFSKNKIKNPETLLF